MEYINIWNEETKYIGVDSGDYEIEDLNLIGEEELTVAVIKIDVGYSPAMGSFAWTTPVICDSEGLMINSRKFFRKNWG